MMCKYSKLNLHGFACILLGLAWVRSSHSLASIVLPDSDAKLAVLGGKLSSELFHTQASPFLCVIETATESRTRAHARQRVRIMFIMLTKASKYSRLAV